MTVTRRSFIESAGASAGAAALLLVLPACGGDAGGSGAGFGAGCRATAIAGNHAAPNSHSLSVPAADVQSNVARNYTTGGTIDHVHTVTLSAGDLQTLANGGSVTVVSTTGSSANFPAHTHAMTITC